MADPTLIRSIPGAFVYNHPTIASLAAYVLNIANGTQVQPSAGAGTANADADASARRVDAMHALLRKYGSDFRAHGHGVVACAPPSKKRKRGSGSGDGDGEKEVVVMTGTTGWLGALMLAELLRDRAVKRVFALNRKVATGAELTFERQVRALEEKGIDAKLAASNKLVLLDTDLTVEGFGLDEEVLDEVKRLFCLC